MTERQRIDPYIRTVFYMNGLPNLVVDGYVRRSIIENSIFACFVEALEPYDKDIMRGREYLAGNTFDILLANNAISEDPDPVAGSYFLFKPSSAAALRDVVLTGDEIYQRYRRVGQQFLYDVFAINRVDDLTLESDTGDIENNDNELNPVLGSIPASDRLVNLDDNQPEVSEARQAVADLNQKLLQGNDVGDLTAEEVDVASVELIQLKDALDQPVVRQSSFVSRAQTTLRWIAEKAAGTAVGKAAWALLVLLLSIFGIHLNA